MLRQTVALLLVALLVFVASSETAKTYHYHKLVRVNVAAEEALAQLQKVVGIENLDVWSHDGRMAAGLDMDIMMPPQAFEQLLSLYESFHPANSSFNAISVSKFDLLHNNVQQLVDAHMQENAAANGNDDWFAKYRSYDEVKQFTRDLADKYSNIASYFSMGQSWENRDLFGIKISAPSANNGPKPVLLLNALQHAREWISTMVVQYAMRQFLELYTSKDQRIVDLLSKIDVVIIPFVNPDGYAYTWSGSRLWRKNRRQDSSAPYGVDLNRNWKIGYGVGASKDPRSDVFQGPHPLSEKESIAYDAFMRSLGSQIKAGIDFHSYSQLVLRPWDYQYTTCKDETELRILGGSMQTAIANVHGVKYQNIRGVELYPAGGALNDNFYGEYNFFGYTIELRDTGRYGFLLPPAQILPTSEENWGAVLVLADFVAKKA